MENRALGGLRGLEGRAIYRLLIALILSCLALWAYGQPEPAPLPTPAPTATPTAEPTASPVPASAAVATPQAKDTVAKEVIEEWTTIPQGTDAAAPEGTPQEPGGAIGFSRYVFERVGNSVLTTLVEGPRDGQVRVPVSYDQLGKLRDDGGSISDLRMTPEELAALVDQLDVVREATEKYVDIEEAFADGYVQSTEEVPNMGAHFVQPWRMLDGKFDPKRPEILLYTSDDQGDWTLVGTSFVLPINVVGPDHPEAFAGPLDNWHVHYELCTGSDFNSRSSTEQECREEGGTWVPVYGWDGPRLGLGGQSARRIQHVESERRACRSAVGCAAGRNRWRRAQRPHPEFRIWHGDRQDRREPDVDKCRRRRPHRHGGFARQVGRRIRLRLRCARGLIRVEIRSARALPVHVHPALIHVRHCNCDPMTVDWGR